MKSYLGTMLKDVFEPDQIQDIILFLDFNDVYQKVENSLIYINDIKNEYDNTKSVSSTSLNFIWAGLILTFSDFIKTSRINKDKDGLKYSADISNYLLRFIITKTIESFPEHMKRLMLEEMSNTVVGSCNVFNADTLIVKHGLFLLDFSSTNIEKYEESNPPAVLKIPLGLIWNNDEKKLDDFLLLFIKYKLCEESQISKIKQLFSFPAASQQIIFNASNQVAVILFLFHLSDSRMVNWTGKSLYEVIAFHSINYKSEILKQEEPRTVNYRYSRKKEGKALIEQFERDFKLFC